MKMDITELRRMVERTIDEAKKKRGKKKDAPEEREVHPAGYSYAESFDFSRPLGALNAYARQGVANFGPYTGDGSALSELVKEDAVPADSAWSIIAEAIRRELPPSERKNVWESALHWYDFHQRGLGSADGLTETHIGFKKLANKLAHKKGVTDPRALAASIGRKKYGKKGMARRAAAGRK